MLSPYVNKSNICRASKIQENASKPRIIIAAAKCLIKRVSGTATTALKLICNQI